MTLNDFRPLCVLHWVREASQLVIFHFFIELHTELDMLQKSSGEKRSFFKKKRDFYHRNSMAVLIAGKDFRLNNAFLKLECQLN